MLDKKITTEPHHRRPRSLGGSNKEFNLSYVKSDPHKQWHTLFGNLNANQISEFINEDLRNYRKPYFVTCRFINGSEVKKSGKGGSKDPRIRSEAWRNLFFNNISSMKDIIAYINNVWFDPSYHLYLKKRKL